MADAPVLGTGVSDVQVQVLSPAPKNRRCFCNPCFFYDKRKHGRNFGLSGFYHFILYLRTASPILLSLQTE